MLVRSAGRRQGQTNRILASSFAQLQLPWLAPAQLRWSASQAPALERPSSRRRQIDAPRLQQVKAQTRELATAAGQIAVTDGAAYPPPAYRLTHSAPGFRNSGDINIPWDHSQTLSAIRPYKNPIIINSTTQDPAKMIKIQHGIQGTTAELLQHLYTSLRIGRFTRAELIIQRLSEQSTPTAPELIHAHTAYLEEMLGALASQAEGSEEAKTTLKAMQDWFQVAIRAKGVVPDAKMLVVMIRAAIRGTDGTERDLAIREYVDAAEAMGEETLDNVLYSEDYDDNEFFIMGVASSDLYQEEAQPAEHEQQVTAEQTQAQSIIKEPPQYHARDDLVGPDYLPLVMSTEQKGTGLANVKRALEDFINMPPPTADLPLETQREQAYERQRTMEETSVEIAIDRWKEADEDLRRMGISTAMQTLQTELKEAKKMPDTQQPNRLRDDDRYHYGPLLELLPAEKVAASTILFVISKIAQGKDRVSGRYEPEMKLNSLTTGLGRAMEAEAIAEASKRRLKEEQKQAKSSAGSKGLSRRIRQKLASNRHTLNRYERSKLLGASEAGRLTWPLAPKVKLGAMLTQKLVEKAQLPVTREHPRTKEKITQMQPAFLHRIKYVAGKKIGVVVPNPALLDKLQSEPLGAVLAKRMPMVVEPKPWTGWSQGGYLHYPAPILRLGVGDRSGKDYFNAADRKHDLEQVYAGLTALGKVPWKVHPGVLKVQIEAWNSGEAVANLAPLNPVIPRPEEPAADADHEERRRWMQDVKDTKHRRDGYHSKRCFQNFQLEIARSVVNETLYFPHNLDFRGRAYPIPPYLNHMGADNVRGLLVFAEGKPLGEGGLRWLKIHLATVAGHDKASMSERVAFTEKHMEEIYDSVRNPLGGGRWWLKSEDAWQTLAACFELTAALDSEDPTQFLSTIPVQQDGTCNGLQHYAALGGDMVGARQVNLEPGDRPADVYTAVMQAVAEEVAKDAAAGNLIAKKLDGRLTRKCVKQPVMTNVYGVTFYGAKEQVAKQLEVLFPEVNRYDEVNLGRMSLYVATKIFKSLGEMFSGAQAIQHWLGTCADRIATCLTPEQIDQLIKPPPEPTNLDPPKPRRITRAEEVSLKKQAEDIAAGRKPTPYRPRHAPKPDSESAPRREAGSTLSDRAMRDELKPLFKSTVVWTTPLRLPVVQPYRKSKTNTVRTSFQSIALQEPQVWDPVSKRKQLQAFPPNFIHSLDATHMLLSALKCDEEGMTFASIHDSFWTHACDVDRLSILLRDAFVEMHSEDIIGRLKEEFELRYKGSMYLANIAAKSPVGAKITEWRRQNAALGAGKAGELKLEKERMRLLLSESEEEQALGKAMLTPGAIVDAEADKANLLASSSLRGQSLGNMPENVESVEFEATNSDADALGDPTEATDDSAALTEGVVSGSVLDTDVEAMADHGSELGKNEDVETGAETAETAAPDVSNTTAASPMPMKKKSRQTPRKTHVWLPMTFPEVPEKGEFDVRRLKASQYFFH
ncbi:DNA-directed RNA polymerase [Recurvomyces mirabilis]|uniref:DNA-directed RNA polymerase n=1 Tax=Recurvomyces mirabilis TaxID=574656 RepID=A0AAE0WUC1_9PEZI|nr:DNA-directed RNA polymerase [Recurvomyces mirabilis]KAK5160506.1 DNA-directed RNA polymerase [Recurvomyces mirabilis]